MTTSDDHHNHNFVVTMVLPKLLSALASVLFRHPTLGPQLVQRLADSRPIRAAARVTAYAYLRSRQALEERLLKPGAKAIKDSSGGGVDLERFKHNFAEEIKKGLREASEAAAKKK